MKRRRGSVVSWMLMLAGVFVVIAVGESMDSLQALDRTLAEQPGLQRSLLGACGGMALGGLLLLVTTQFAVRVGDEWRETGGRGWASGFSDTMSLGEVKQALRTGQMWREPRWRRFALMALGAALTVFGLFGLVMVLASPGIKLLLGIVLGYALARTAWAVVRA